MNTTNIGHTGIINIPNTSKKRVVIVGGGFAGLNLVNRIDDRYFQTVLLDSNNYHQFQPLLYQIASAGLQSESISFPFRKLLQSKRDFYFRLASVKKVDFSSNTIDTTLGTFGYDYLVLAAGTTTNFYGNGDIEKTTFPMKTVEEALQLRNAIFSNLEEALSCDDSMEKQSLLNIVIVGGGATGVEVAGAIAEMKRFVLPKDYPDLPVKDMNIYLVESNTKILGHMSPKASYHSKRFLERLGVTVLLSKKVTDYKNEEIIFDTGESVRAKTVIWVSGVTAVRFEGLSADMITRGNRIIVDQYNRVKGSTNVFSIGDMCFQPEDDYPHGHPQVAPVGIQQGRLLAKNLRLLERGKEMIPFQYKDKGSLATIGRNKAVAEIKVFLKGFPAWAVWMLVHLRYILGVKHKLIVLIDWIWNYLSYDNSQRSILYVCRPDCGKSEDGNSPASSTT